MLVVPEFADNEGNLPHTVNVTDKFLLTVLEERESKRPDYTNNVLTRLGTIASGGRLGVRQSVCKNFKKGLRWVRV